MPSKIIEGLLKKVGLPDLIETLTERLSPGELQSLLLPVFEKQAAQISASDLFRQYQQNRFVKPSDLPVAARMAFDQLAFGIAAKFKAIELAPVSPLGTCSALGTVHQNKVLSALRNVEVTSDSTNMMALEAAVERKKLLNENPKDRQTVNLCSSHRLIRTQYFEDPTFTAHFRVFSMVSAGRDQGNFTFETEQLYQQLAVYLQILDNVKEIGLQVKTISAGITILDEAFLRSKVETQLFEPLQKEYPGVRFYFNDERQNGRGYYKTLCFNLDAQNAQGQEFNLADGGCTDWSQLLLQNRKERLLISGIGSEILCKCFN
jgi:hypothetical protein